VRPLEPPPDDLGGFPTHKLEPGRLLYRIHRSDRSPWWFSNDGSGRFDLFGEDTGTCYLAERPVGTFIEVFRTGTLIPEVEVSVRSLARLRVPSATRLANCTASEARRFGITAAIHSQPNYNVPRAWAQAFADVGFGGVLYRLSHDPSVSEIGVALFGGAAEQVLPIESTGSIPDDVLEEGRTRFGLLVLPTPG
jgi:RES domain